MTRLFTLLLLALLVLSVVFPVSAQEEDEEEAQATVDTSSESTLESEGSHQGLTYADVASGFTILPDYDDDRFPASATVEALIAFTNHNNEQAYHVEYIRGLLRVPTPPYEPIQNFSGALYNTTIAPGTEHCLLYRFMADPSIANQEYELRVELFYKNDVNETYLAVVHNGTVFVEDAPTSIDAHFFFASALLLGMIGSAGYGVWRYVRKSSRRSGPRARREESASAPAAAAASGEAPKVGKGGIDWEYISGDHAKLAKGEKRTSPPRKESPTRKGRTSPSRKVD